MRIIGGVKTLLHDQGMTIRGVQKLFREEGLKHVSSFSAPLDGDLADAASDDAATIIDVDPTPAPPAPAARSSHDATPDPVEAPAETVTSEEDEIVSDTPLFSHRSASRPVSEVTAEEQDSEPEVEKPSIPPTPDVPATDPVDDDADFVTGHGVAAKLRLAKRASLEAKRTDLEEAAVRLKALLERVS